MTNDCYRDATLVVGQAGQSLDWGRVGDVTAFEPQLILATLILLVLANETDTSINQLRMIYLRYI